MCWVFRKKAFYVSGEFREALGDLIKALISKTRKVQVDLLGAKLKDNNWKVLGFIGAFFLESIGICSVEVWTIRLKSDEVNKIFSEWEKSRQL
jgi:hypothetical protein